MNEELAELQKTYQQHFSEQASHGYFSPGRINLIGEHLDYNGGAVMPAAISLGTYGLVNLRKDRRVRVYSHNFAGDGLQSFSLDQLSYSKGDSWLNYVKGVLWQLEKLGYALRTGFDLLIYGSLPHGSGLSSSASLELLLGYMCNDLFDLALAPKALAQLGMQVENGYIGVNSGIMDQFAIALGRKGYALFLDTATLAYEHVLANIPNYSWLIMNTNKPRQLADSKYNQRKQECDQALALIQPHFAIEHLSQLPLTALDDLAKIVKEERLVARVRHIVSEHQRTLAAKELLASGDSLALGQLLKESHHSLAHDYEVAGVELNTLVHAANSLEGVAGARMTGAGFGGCAIALVENRHLEMVRSTVSTVYLAKIGYAAGFSTASITGQLHKIF